MTNEEIFLNEKLTLQAVRIVRSKKYLEYRDDRRTVSDAERYINIDPEVIRLEHEWFKWNAKARSIMYSESYEFSEPDESQSPDESLPTIDDVPDEPAKTFDNSF